MANNIYCTHCGKKNNFEIVKPKNCAFCKKSFACVEVPKAISSVKIEPEIKPEAPIRKKISLAGVEISVRSNITNIEELAKQETPIKRNE